MKKKKIALLSLFLFFLFILLVSVSLSQTGLFFFSGTPAKIVKDNLGEWKLFGSVNITNGTVTAINFTVG